MRALSSKNLRTILTAASDVSIVLLDAYSRQELHHEEPGSQEGMSLSCLSIEGLAPHRHVLTGCLIIPHPHPRVLPTSSSNARSPTSAGCVFSRVSSRVFRRRPSAPTRARPPRRRSTTRRTSSTCSTSPFSRSFESTRPSPRSSPALSAVASGVSLRVSRRGGPSTGSTTSSRRGARRTSLALSSFRVRTDLDACHCLFPQVPDLP